MDNMNITTVLAMLTMAATMGFHLLIRPRMDPGIDTRKPAVRAERIIVVTIGILTITALLEGPATLLTVPLHLTAGYNAGKMIRETSDAVTEFKAQARRRQPPRNAK